MKKYSERLSFWMRGNILIVLGICMLTIASCKKKDEVKEGEKQVVEAAKKEGRENEANVNPIDSYLQQYDLLVTKHIELYKKVMSGDEDSSKEFNASTENLTRKTSDGYGLELKDFTEEQVARLKEIRAKFDNLNLEE